MFSKSSRFSNKPFNQITKTLFTGVISIGLTITALHSQADTKQEVVVVTASRVETPLREVGASISVIDQQEIELRGQATIADLLRTVPSINVSNSGGVGKTTGLRIRGEETFRTKVIIDGIDVSDPTGTQVQSQIQHILTSQAERIEVLRGPQGMMYGADSGGIINIITKKPEEGVQGNISYEVGRYDTEMLSGNIRGKVDKFDYSLSATNHETDGFNARSDDVSNEDDGNDNTTLNAKLGFDATSDLRIEFIARDVEADGEYDSCGFLTYIADCTTRYEQKNKKINLLYSQDKFNHELSYATTEVDRRFFTESFFSFGGQGQITEVQYLGSYALTDSTSLVYGVDMDEEVIEEDLDDFGKTLDIERDQRGVYLELQNSIDEKLFYTLGVRQDNNDDFGSFTSFRLTSAYLINTGSGELKVKGSFGNGFRAPSVFEITTNASVPAAEELAEERSKGYDIGVEYTAGPWFAEIVYFSQKIKDDIEYDSSIGAFGAYTQIEGISRSTGIEANTDYNVNKNLVLSATYTLNNAVQEDGSPRARRPRTIYNLSASYVTSNDKFSITGNYRAVKDQVDSFGDIEDYEVLDVSANYKINDSLEVYSRLENALDEDYQEIPNFNAPRQAVYAGARYRF